LVEQRIENPRVGGSIPPQATSQNSLKNQGIPKKRSVCHVHQVAFLLVFDTFKNHEDFLPAAMPKFSSGGVALIHRSRPIKAIPPRRSLECKWSVNMSAATGRKNEISL
jgi:hypothetical protein